MESTSTRLKIDDFGSKSKLEELLLNDLIH